MEFKTCEQYVLAQLDTVEKKNAELEDKVKEQAEEIGNYKEREAWFYDLLNKMGFKIGETSTGDPKVETDSIYSWEKEKFDGVMNTIRLLGLESTYTKK